MSDPARESDFPAGSPAEVYEGAALAERKAALLKEPGELDKLLAVPVGGGVQLFGTADPLEALDKAEALVQKMQRIVDKARDRYIARIPTPGGGIKDYPKVDWWTSMGFALNLIPRLVGDVVETKPGDFMCTIEVWHMEKGVLVTRAQGFCSMGEMTPKGNHRWNDEYAARAMCQTRGIGRAFRGPLGGLAALAGLEATPAEEMTGIHEREKAAKAAAAAPKPRQASAAPKAQPAKPQAAPEGSGAARPLRVGEEVTGRVLERQADSGWLAWRENGDRPLCDENDVIYTLDALRRLYRADKEKAETLRKGTAYMRKVNIEGVGWVYTTSNWDDPAHPWAINDPVTGRCTLTALDLPGAILPRVQTIRKAAAPPAAGESVPEFDPKHDDGIPY